MQVGSDVRPKAASLSVLDGNIQARIAGIRCAASDTNLYELDRLDGAAFPSFEPGAHIDLHLPNGMVRQYSLIGAGDNPTTYVIGVKFDRNGRGGSRYVHEDLRIGDVVAVSEPRNNFPLVETTDPVVLIAGGIGITPIWSMVQHLLASGRPWQLHYSARAQSEAVFFEHLKPLAQVSFHFDDENNGRFLDIDSIVSSAPDNAHLYCCGPKPMLEAFERSALRLPRAKVHTESFGARLSAATQGGFTVELARSRRTFMVPQGQTILQVLREAGVDVASSCEQGVCGACETGLISGTPEHHDAVLTDDERAANDRVMICCVGCINGPLVLDL